MSEVSEAIDILHVSTGLSTGGAERMLYNLLCQTDRSKFQPTVLSLLDMGTYGPKIVALGIPVHTLNMKRGLATPSSLLQFLRLMRQLSPDLIQGWMYHGNLVALLTGLLVKGQPKVFWGIHNCLFANSDQKQLTALVLRLGAVFSRLPARIIFVSRMSQKQHEDLGYSPEKSCFIGNGFDTQSFVPSPEARSVVRAELGVPEQAMLIGLFCRYHPMKNHLGFLKMAAALLAQRRPGETLHFVLAGTAVDDQNQLLVQQIQALGITHSVSLLGERQDIPQLLAALDLYCLTSAYGEAFPMIVGEAMACGVPCVVTDVGDASVLVGDTGKVVPPGNDAALAAACREFLALDASVRAQWGEAARQRIETLFSLASVVDQYEALYTR